MPRNSLPFSTPDLAAFARTLGKALHARHEAGEPPPGHVALLNLIARASGQRNLQALRAAASPAAPTPAEPPPAAPRLGTTASKALAQFDADGRLQRWPSKFSVQTLVMWVLWTRFDGKRIYSEREVNAILKDAHTYGDHVTLRRELINHRLLERKSDCSAYWKRAVRPDDETRALLGAWRSQRQAAPAPARQMRPDAPARRAGLSRSA